jgi:hypothetical protein
MAVLLLTHQDAMSFPWPRLCQKTARVQRSTPGAVSFSAAASRRCDQSNDRSMDFLDGDKHDDGTRKSSSSVSAPPRCSARLVAAVVRSDYAVSDDQGVGILGIAVEQLLLDGLVT